MIKFQKVRTDLVTSVQPRIDFFKENKWIFGYSEI